MKNYIKPTISIDNIYVSKAIANNDYFFTEDDPQVTPGGEVEISASNWWESLFGSQN